MKKLRSRNKKIEYYHEVSGFSFSICRRDLKDNYWDLNYSCIGLYRFADDVMTELKKYIDGNYRITWRDIHFDYNFEELVLTVIDSKGIAYKGEINTNHRELIEYKGECIKLFVDQIISAYYVDEEAYYIASGQRPCMTLKNRKKD